MAVDLSDEQFIDSLKREVTPLGSNMFDAITDATWIGYLTDAFWEAKLEGFLVGYTVDEDGLIEPDSGTTDLDRKWIALIVLYAGIRILRQRILNTNTQFRAKAGPVEFEQQSSATMLAEMLKQLRATKDQILTELEDETDALMLDIFSMRVFNGGYWANPELAG